MDERTALHTVARRYCEARFSEWSRAYAELQQNEDWQVEKLFQPGWDYSDEAYRTFPRYRIAKNIQVEIERITPSSVPSMSAMRTKLVGAAEKAHADLEAELKNRLAQGVMRDELDDFRAYITALAPSDLAGIEKLPYRRVLSIEESERLWGELTQIWGIGEGYWFPLKDGPIPPNVLAFHTDYFESIRGETILRESLEERGVSTIYLLREFGDPHYEIELGIFSPRCGDGGEEYSTSRQADWLVYASHESSITIGGFWLIDAFRRLHPECIERTYKGPYSTMDLRGTWETD